MEYSPETQKQYFQFAYKTGSDIWTHIPYRYQAEKMLPVLPRDALFLDVGAGRGLWTMKLVSLGYRVLGIDYIPLIVDKANERIHEDGYEDRARFVLGNVLDIPFVDEGFDMATDIGTLQHFENTDWHQYQKEISRVLKKGGYYLLVTLSRKTRKLLGWNPSISTTGDFSKFGVHYHFFTQEEIQTIFGENFNIINQHEETYQSQSDPDDETVLLFTLMQKK